jgi:hypothetical protein
MQELSLAGGQGIALSTLAPAYLLAVLLFLKLACVPRGEKRATGETIP